MTNIVDFPKNSTKDVEDEWAHLPQDGYDPCDQLLPLPQEVNVHIIKTVESPAEKVLKFLTGFSCGMLVVLGIVFLAGQVLKMLGVIW